jgi:hypothetical protein
VIDAVLLRLVLGVLLALGVDLAWLGGKIAKIAGTRRKG